MSDQPIQRGSIVEARRGGPRMQVRCVIGKLAACFWFDADGKRHVDRFRLDALVPVSTAGGTPPGAGGGPGPSR